MPYLHFDLPARYPAEVKRALAARLGALYAEIMQTSPGIVKVSFRELGEENLFRCGAPDGGVEPVVVGQCDIRRGRPTAQRAALAAAIVAACSEALGVDAAMIELEFTQHAGDEMYRRGAFAQDWTAAESGRSENSANRSRATGT
jgi:phenylpyruvate tautomerase PptA (4-oxalocrotonate tautomerase family)